jgi:hypothetical protein
VNYYKLFITNARNKQRKNGLVTWLTIQEHNPNYPKGLPPKRLQLVVGYERVAELLYQEPKSEMSVAYK